MIEPETISCWKINYGLDKRTPEEAARWWEDNLGGKAPAGAVAALGLAIQEIERLHGELERLSVKHKETEEYYQEQIEILQNELNHCREMYKRDV